MRKNLVMAILITSLVIGLSSSVLATENVLDVWGFQLFTEEGDKWLKETIEQWGIDNNVKVLYQVVPASVMHQKLAAGFEAQDPPDLFMVQGQFAQQYIGNNMTLNVDDVWQWMKAQGAYEMLEPLFFKDSKAFGIPVEIDIAPYFFRKDLIEDAGYALDDVKTWEKLIEVLRETQDPPRIYGLGMPISRCADSASSIEEFLWAFGAKLFDEEGNAALYSSEAVEAVEILDKMYNEWEIIPKGVLTWDDAGNNKIYQQWQAIAVRNPPSIYFYMVTEDPDLLKVTVALPPPSGPAGSFAAIDSWIWLVPKDTPFAEEVKGLLRYLYEPDRHKEIIDMVGGRWFPVYESLADDPLWQEPFFEHYPEIVARGRVGGYAYHPTPAYGEIMKNYVLVDMVQKVIIGEATAEEAVLEAHNIIQKTVDHYREIGEGQ